MDQDAVTGVAQLDRRVGDGGLVWLDGGMGTELEARGLPMDHDAWSAVANLEHQATVEEAHVDFLEAGVEVIIANTFPAGVVALEAAGLGDRVDETNRRAVEAALRARERAAAGRPVAVAGSIAPLGAGALIRVGDRAPEELLAAHRRQAAVLADAGADLIITEMIQSPEWHRPAVQAAVETGLPVWLGVSAGPPGADGRVPTLEVDGVMLDDVVGGLADLPIRAAAVMHTDLSAVDTALEVVRRRWSGPVAVYPHHGEYQPPSWRWHELDTEELAGRARGWIERGVSVLGGCCGIRPHHLRRLVEALTS